MRFRFEDNLIHIFQNIISYGKILIMEKKYEIRCFLNIIRNLNQKAVRMPYEFKSTCILI